MYLKIIYNSKPNISHFAPWPCCSPKIYMAILTRFRNLDTYVVHSKKLFELDMTFTTLQDGTEPES